MLFKKMRVMDQYQNVLLMKKVFQFKKAVESHSSLLEIYKDKSLEQMFH